MKTVNLAPYSAHTVIDVQRVETCGNEVITPVMLAIGHFHVSQVCTDTISRSRCSGSTRALAGHVTDCADGQSSTNQSGVQSLAKDEWHFDVAAATSLICVPKAALCDHGSAEPEEEYGAFGVRSRDNPGLWRRLSFAPTSITGADKSVSACVVLAEWNALQEPIRRNWSV
jgi:hypothetical protein